MTQNRKDLNAELAQRMAELRRALGRTQQECADALGVGQPAYAELEKGGTRIRRRDLVTLAVLFGMSVEEAFPAVSELRRAA